MTNTTNVRFTVEGDELVLRVKLSETHGVSASGKSEMVASTHGNVKLADGVAFGLNVYRPRR